MLHWHIIKKISISGLILIKKSIRNRSKFRSNFDIDFLLIFEQFIDNFGTLRGQFWKVLGLQTGWLSLAQPYLKASWGHIVCLWKSRYDFWTNFGTLWGPFWEVLASKMGGCLGPKLILKPLGVIFCAFGTPGTTFDQLLAHLEYKNDTSEALEAPIWYFWI